MKISNKRVYGLFGQTFRRTVTMGSPAASTKTRWSWRVMREALRLKTILPLTSVTEKLSVNVKTFLTIARSTLYGAQYLGLMIPEGRCCFCMISTLKIIKKLMDVDIDLCESLVHFGLWEVYVYPLIDTSHIYYYTHGV